MMMTIRTWYGVGLLDDTAYVADEEQVTWYVDFSQYHALVVISLCDFIWCFLQVTCTRSLTSAVTSSKQIAQKVNVLSFTILCDIDRHCRCFIELYELVFCCAV